MKKQAETHGEEFSVREKSQFPLYGIADSADKADTERGVNGPKTPTVSSRVLTLPRRDRGLSIASLADAYQRFGEVPERFHSTTRRDRSS